VPAARSGMASGINNTFRQVGIATGVAGLGAAFQSRIASHLNGAVPKAPTGFDEIVAAGGRRAAVDTSPSQFQTQAGDAATNAFVASFNDILLIGAIVPFAAAVLTFALVRRSDFVDTPSYEPGSGESSPSQPRPKSVQPVVRNGRQRSRERKPPRAERGFGTRFWAAPGVGNIAAAAAWPRRCFQPSSARLGKHRAGRDGRGVGVRAESSTGRLSGLHVVHLGRRSPLRISAKPDSRPIVSIRSTRLFAIAGLCPCEGCRSGWDTATTRPRSSTRTTHPTRPRARCGRSGPSALVPSVVPTRANLRAPQTTRPCPYRHQTTRRCRLVRSHNPKVAGSNPAPATSRKARKRGPFVLVESRRAADRSQ
jgi:hypothetical protein